MANLDNVTTPFKVAITTLAVEDGTGTPLTLTMTLEQGSSITWSETGRTAVEAKVRGRHQGTPVVVETEDTEVTGSITILVSSWKGNSNTHPYEVFSRTGNASAWLTTAIGGALCCKWTVTTNSTVDGGASQAGVFAYTHVDSVEVGESDGLYTITASFTDYENRPTWS